MHHPAGHGVNPLLVAATHANQSQNQHLPNQPPNLHVPGQDQPNIHHHRGHNQTPTNIKLVKAPEYFPEWKDSSVAGMEEAGFLGAQVAAKVVFVVDQGISKGFLTRADYNEMGPGGIHECAM
jgi:actin-related protein 9